MLRDGGEKVAINDALPLEAARRHAIAKFKSFWASPLSDDRKPNAVSLRLAVRRHVNTACNVHDGWR